MTHAHRSEILDFVLWLCNGLDFFHILLPSFESLSVGQRIIQHRIEPFMIMVLDFKAMEGSSGDWKLEMCRGLGRGIAD
jgi:hypothetical protein